MNIPSFSGRSAMLIAALALLGSGPARAQEAQRSTRNQREERIKEHEEKIREIINQRRIAEAERKEALAQREKEMANVERYLDLDRSPNRRALGSVMLYCNFPTTGMPRQLDRFVTEGTQFVSEVVLLNDAIADIEELRLALNFDKRFLKPVKIFDSRIRSLLEGEPLFAVDDRDGVLRYEAKFTKPITQPEMALLTIVWEAVRPTSHTAISFVFSPEELPGVAHTSVTSMERNILGVHFDPIDGVLSGGILIEGKETAAGSAPRLQGKAEELRTMYLGSIGASSKAGLHLVAPEETIHRGDIFPVHVHLHNPLGTLVDTVDFMVSWDPERFELVDRDRLNSIRNGVNAWDGPYREDYPFDYLKANEGEVRRGLLRYSASLGDGRSLPTGTFATFFLRARQASAGSPVRFLRSRPGMPNLTSIRYFGYEIISFDQPWSIAEVTIAVANPAEGQKPVDYSKALMESLKVQTPAIEPPERETAITEVPAQPVQELGMPR